MAAAILRAGRLGWVKCFQLDRASALHKAPVAAFSTTSGNSNKRPRKTSIKKAKPKSIIDIAKLVQQRSNVETKVWQPSAIAAALKAASGVTRPSAAPKPLAQRDSFRPAVAKTQTATATAPAAAGTIATTPITVTETPVGTTATHEVNAGGNSPGPPAPKDELTVLSRDVAADLVPGSASAENTELAVEDKVTATEGKSDLGVSLEQSDVQASVVLEGPSPLLPSQEAITTETAAITNAAVEEIVTESTPPELSKAGPEIAPELETLSSSSDAVPSGAEDMHVKPPSTEDAATDIGIPGTSLTDVPHMEAPPLPEVGLGDKNVPEVISEEAAEFIPDAPAAESETSAEAKCVKNVHSEDASMAADNAPLLEPAVEDPLLQTLEIPAASPTSETASEGTDIVQAACPSITEDTITNTDTSLNVSVLDTVTSEAGSSTPVLAEETFTQDATSLSEVHHESAPTMEEVVTMVHESLDVPSEDAPASLPNVPSVESEAVTAEAISATEVQEKEVVIAVGDSGVPETEAEDADPQALDIPERQVQVEVKPTGDVQQMEAESQEEAVEQAEVIEEAVEASEAHLDPIQRLFLDKIREYSTKSEASGGVVDAGLEYERALSEEMAKLQRLFGSGDPSTFPEFKFHEPKFDEVSTK